MKKNMIGLIAGFLLVLLVSPVYAAPVFVNGSFEDFSGDVTDPYTNLIDDALVNGWSNTYNRIDIFSTPGYNASDGSSALRLHPTIDQVYQTVSGFNVGSTYSLSFDMAAQGVWHDNGDSTSYWSNMADFGQGIDILLNDASIGTISGSAFDSSAIFGSNPFTYVSYTMDFVAMTEAIEFQFNLLDLNDDGGVVLDNLSISGGTAPVPEPATFILLGAGLAGLAIYRRRK